METEFVASIVVQHCNTFAIDSEFLDQFFRMDGLHTSILISDADLELFDVKTLRGTHEGDACHKVFHPQRTQVQSCRDFPRIQKRALQNAIFERHFRREVQSKKGAHRKAHHIQRTFETFCERRQLFNLFFRISQRRMIKRLDTPKKSCQLSCMIQIFFQSIVDATNLETRLSIFVLGLCLRILFVDNFIFVNKG